MVDEAVSRRVRAIRERLNALGQGSDDRVAMAAQTLGGRLTGSAVNRIRTGDTTRPRDETMGFLERALDVLEGEPADRQPPQQPQPVRIPVGPQMWLVVEGDMDPQNARILARIIQLADEEWERG